MTEFELKWSEKCIKEYVIAQIFGSKALLFAMAAVYAVGFIAVPVFGIVAYCMTRFLATLIIAATCLAIGIFLAALLVVLINNSAKKTHKTLSESEGLICAVSDKDVLLIKNNLPYGVIDWSKITEITETKSAFCLMTNDNLLLILEKDAVHSGVLSEAEEVLKIKSEALEKKQGAGK